MNESFITSGRGVKPSTDLIYCNNNAYRFAEPSKFVSPRSGINVDISFVHSDIEPPKSDLVAGDGMNREGFFGLIIEELKEDGVFGYYGTSFVKWLIYKVLVSHGLELPQGKRWHIGNVNGTEKDFTNFDYSMLGELLANKLTHPLKRQIGVIYYKDNVVRKNYYLFMSEQSRDKFLNDPFNNDSDLAVYTL